MLVFLTKSTLEGVSTKHDGRLLRPRHRRGLWGAVIPMRPWSGFQRVRFVARVDGWAGMWVVRRSRKLDTERRGREEGEGDFAALRPPAAQSTMVEDDKRRGLPICTSAVACSSSGACQCGCIRVEGPAMLSCVRSCGDQLAGPAGSLTTHEDALPAVYLHVSGSPIPHRLAFAPLLAAGA